VGKPIEEDEHVQGVLLRYHVNPKQGYQRAARLYLREHPDAIQGEEKEQSAVRRLARKAERMEPTLPDLLRLLHGCLDATMLIIERILEREKRLK
jgi:hypothetical protein